MDLPNCRDPEANNHPIRITPSGEKVVVHFNGQIVAESVRAMVLREAGYDPVVYVPREDCRTETMKRSQTQTRCPYKGAAKHFSLCVEGKQASDACYSYEAPCPVAAPVAEYVAFYPDRVDRIEGVPAE